MLRIPLDNPLVWQLALTDADVETSLAFKHRRQPREKKKKEPETLELEGGVERREVDEDEVCPICQEDMLPTEALGFCREGCGNSIHAKCMQIWVDHQKTSNYDDKCECPLCRTQWSEGSIQALRKQCDAAARGSSVTCCACRAFPLEGLQHRCLTCR